MDIVTRLASILLAGGMVLSGTIEDAAPQHDPKGTLFLVNRQYTVSDGYEPAELTEAQVPGSVREMRPEAAAVIAMAKRYGMIVATGHISAEEGLAVVRECAVQGVQALVTHADNPADCYTTEQQQEAVSFGAVIEHCYFTTYYDRTPAHIVAEQIRAVGVENVILSTDFGQPKSPYSDEGLELYAQVMAKEGFTDGELTMMFRTTPEKLLGIRRS